MTNLTHKFFNTFITILFMYMFLAISRSSSGGQIVLIQHLVSSLSVGDRSVHRLRRNSTCALNGHLPWFEATLTLLHIVFWNLTLGKTIYVRVKWWYRKKSLGENQDDGLWFVTEKIHTKISLPRFILPLLLGHRKQIKYLESPI
jgi:hypothetical protein